MKSPKPLCGRLNFTAFNWEAHSFELSDDSRYGLFGATDNSRNCLALLPNLPNDFALYFRRILAIWLYLEVKSYSLYATIKIGEAGGLEIRDVDFGPVTTDLLDQPASDAALKPRLRLYTHQSSSRSADSRASITAERLPPRERSRRDCAFR